MTLIQKVASGLAIAVLATIVLFILLPTSVKSDTEKHTKESLLASRVSAIADAILAAEGSCGNGGSGEYGCFQYLPSTWRAYSVEVAGEVLAQTKENERRITEGMIQKWLAEGISERGIFLIWNQGSATGWGGGTDCYSGINKHGVRYDSCDYANRALGHLAARQASTTPTI